MVGGRYVHVSMKTDYSAQTGDCASSRLAFPVPIPNLYVCQPTKPHTCVSLPGVSLAFPLELLTEGFVFGINVYWVRQDSRISMWAERSVDLSGSQYVFLSNQGLSVILGRRSSVDQSTKSQPLSRKLPAIGNVRRSRQRSLSTQ